MSNNQSPQQSETSPFPNQYSRTPLVIDHGEGSRLYDEAGNSYLDFGSGIAVNAFGHGDRDIASVISSQAGRLIHVSNLFASRPALDLAEALRLGLSSYTFEPIAAVNFGNSGSEANEAAIKYARAYSMRTRGQGNHRLLSFTNAFHGRTMGSLSVTPKEAYRAPFEPLVPGTSVLPFNDPGALEAELDSSYAAVIVEVVQGEGGLAVMTQEFAAALNTLCRKHDVLLIADEVQTGLGRCGDLLASEIAGLEPDMVTLSKPLAGGLPLSATLIPDRVNDMLRLGDHGTTFGGGPVTTAAALMVWEKLNRPGFLSEVRGKADHLEKGLELLAGEYSWAGPLKGLGMLRGIDLEIPEGLENDYMRKTLGEAQKQGMMLLRTGKHTLRLAPPLVITMEEIDEGLEKLSRVFKHLDSIIT
ncbi:MAG: aminotransferase class III-fold pyridoxal phosphate-dependent enzyme [Spirochaetales bacterium]|nr:aminotransferase class III-fold pyridoxal phosphate-dependent enzyme [Spirochaetales bacterium]MCF7938103.1 aminotransferase class III-fold pyridoxal phosphate-dependent enzyme [Spirochaetales bacterium]